MKYQNNLPHRGSILNTILLEAMRYWNGAAPETTPISFSLKLLHDDRKQNYTFELFAELVYKGTFNVDLKLMYCALKVYEQKNNYILLILFIFIFI